MGLLDWYEHGKWLEIGQKTPSETSVRLPVMLSNENNYALRFHQLFGILSPISLQLPQLPVATPRTPKRMEEAVNSSGRLATISGASELIVSSNFEAFRTPGIRAMCVYFFQKGSGKGTIVL